ncbi:LuxR C-terminal-related transcriptional regulator [Rhodococcus tukisamuensis]|uniref:Regulatory protein, luxR family n=1 Tax=Rhodococcus tukisamuensis TaxID=168276 RepID=A0A1G6SCW8_9NOCA|nr:regulatory protein, luxR family [Rhodococcus tukisamuensis]
MSTTLNHLLHRPHAPRPRITAATAALQAPVARPALIRPTLSAREIEVLLRWLHCDSKSAVAADMYLSLGTVNTHLARIRAKYAQVGRAAPTKAALVARAVQDGLISIDEL